MRWWVRPTSVVSDSDYEDALHGVLLRHLEAQGINACVVQQLRSELQRQKTAAAQRPGRQSELFHLFRSASENSFLCGGFIVLVGWALCFIIQAVAGQFPLEAAVVGGAVVAGASVVLIVAWFVASRGHGAVALRRLLWAWICFYGLLLVGYVVYAILKEESGSGALAVVLLLALALLTRPQQWWPSSPVSPKGTLLPIMPAAHITEVDSQLSEVALGQSCKEVVRAPAKLDEQPKVPLEAPPKIQMKSIRNVLELDPWAIDHRTEGLSTSLAATEVPVLLNCRRYGHPSSDMTESTAYQTDDMEREEVAFTEQTENDSVSVTAPSGMTAGVSFSLNGHNGENFEEQFAWESTGSRIQAAPSGMQHPPPPSRGVSFSLHGHDGASFAEQIAWESTGSRIQVAPSGMQHPPPPSRGVSFSLNGHDGANFAEQFSWESTGSRIQSRRGTAMVTSTQLPADFGRLLNRDRVSFSQEARMIECEKEHYSDDEQEEDDRLPTFFGRQAPRFSVVCNTQNNGSRAESEDDDESDDEESTQFKNSITTDGEQSDADEDEDDADRTLLKAMKGSAKAAARALRSIASKQFENSDSEDSEEERPDKLVASSLDPLLEDSMLEEAEELDTVSDSNGGLKNVEVGEQSRGSRTPPVNRNKAKQKKKRRKEREKEEKEPVPLVTGDQVLGAAMHNLTQKSTFSCPVGRERLNDMRKALGLPQGQEELREALSKISHGSTSGGLSMKDSHALTNIDTMSHSDFDRMREAVAQKEALEDLMFQTNSSFFQEPSSASGFDTDSMESDSASNSMGVPPPPPPLPGSALDLSAHREARKGSNRFSLGPLGLPRRACFEISDAQTTGAGGLTPLLEQDEEDDPRPRQELGTEVSGSVSRKSLMFEQDSEPPPKRRSIFMEPDLAALDIQVSLSKALRPSSPHASASGGILTKHLCDCPTVTLQILVEKNSDLAAMPLQELLTRARDEGLISMNDAPRQPMSGVVRRDSLTEQGINLDSIFVQQMLTMLNGGQPPKKCHCRPGGPHTCMSPAASAFASMAATASHTVAATVSATAAQTAAVSRRGSQKGGDLDDELSDESSEGLGDSESRSESRSECDIKSQDQQPNSAIHRGSNVAETGDLLNMDPQPSKGGVEELQLDLELVGQTSTEALRLGSPRRCSADAKGSPSSKRAAAGRCSGLKHKVNLGIPSSPHSHRKRSAGMAAGVLNLAGLSGDCIPQILDHDELTVSVEDKCSPVQLSARGSLFEDLFSKQTSHTELAQPEEDVAEIMPDDYERVSPEELAIELAAMSVLVIDVRGRDFKGGHIPGCENMRTSSILENPGAAIELCTAEVVHIVFTCMYSKLRAPRCAAAVTRHLRQKASLAKSLNVSILQGGMHGWVNHWHKMNTASHDFSTYITEFDSAVWQDCAEVGRAEGQPFQYGLVHSMDAVWSEGGQKELALALEDALRDRLRRVSKDLNDPDTQDLLAVQRMDATLLLKRGSKRGSDTSISYTSTGDASCTSESFCIFKSSSFASRGSCLSIPSIPENEFVDGASGSGNLHLSDKDYKRQRRMSPFESGVNH